MSNIIHEDNVFINERLKNKGDQPWGVAFSKNVTPNGNILFEKIGENKITIALANQITRFLMGEDQYATQFQMLDKEDSLNVLDTVSVIDDHPKLFGYGLSIDGGSENMTEPVKRHTKGYNLNNGLIPFRIRERDLLSDEVLNEIHNSYDVRDLTTIGELNNNDLYCRYLIKRFNSSMIRNITENNDELENYPHITLQGDINVYSVIDLELVIDYEDLREHFTYIEGDVNFRRYNGITIFMGVPTIKEYENGYSINSYSDILGTNRMNVRQRNLGRNGTQTIVYRIYV